MANNVLAYGFTDLANQASARLSEVGGRAVFDAIVSSASYHTEQLNRVLDGMCRRTTDYKWRYHLPNGGTLQPMDDNGRPLSNVGSVYFDVALPIQMGGSSNGFNWVAFEKATVEEANAKTLNMQRQDADWMVRHVLAAIFTNTTWSFADPLRGTLTIQPLANADGTLYPIIGGSTEDSQHFLAQAAAIADATNPFPTMLAQLAKHPSNNTSANDVVAYVPSNVVGAVEALASFVPVGDTDVAVGVGSDRIVANAGRIASILGPGDEVLGKVGKVWIVEWKRLPDSYLIGQVLGTEAPVGFREEPESSLQGLIVKDDSRALTKETMVFRRAGFGIVNRVGMVVQRVSNGTYAIPTGYTAPLAV